MNCHCQRKEKLGTPYVLARKLKCYYGLNIPNQEAITEKEFPDYVDAYIIPEFPYVTIYTTKGHYINQNNQSVDETTKVVEMIIDTKLSLKEVQKKIQLITRPYYTKFNQEYPPFVVIDLKTHANFLETP